MIRAGIGLALILLLSVGFAFAVRIRSAPPPDDNRYVGSAKCENCHRAQFAAWHQSQHNKMMRPFDRPGVLVADFGAKNAPFDPKQGVWAIGGKWEQQYLGRDKAGETLLPGAWFVAERSWQTVGWDGWNKPVPRERCDGCHTVGLDAQTGEFQEPNIGCEACHGPGGWHVRTLGLGAISALPDAEVCGQCHSRGNDTSGRFYFPVGYRPGGKLDKYFSLEHASLGQTSSDWWGDGRARTRHEEYPDWRRGGHSTRTGGRSRPRSTSRSPATPPR